YRPSSAAPPSPDLGIVRPPAPLPQPKLNVPLPSVPEVSELEGSSLSGKTHGWYKQKKASHYSDSSWKETDDKDSFKPEQDVHRRSSLRSHIEEGDDDINTKAEKPSSGSSLSILKHTPHRAYWVEQQNRLPLPLTELMENEALEILTKALWSYRSGIGWDHFLTKQLQRYIERLKRRQNKRLHVSVH
uniref:Cation channel sperm-associated protein subunit zeta n=1 Tax=Camelus bactrianus TaxID=9837 RepID=A0A9W3GUD7_CAMBA